MTVVSDISNRLSADAEYVNGSAFYTAVFEYGMGIIELLADWGYQPGVDAMLEIDAALGSAEVYTEGQALPSPIEATTLQAKFTHKHFRAVIRESGHERRARGLNDSGMRISVPDKKMADAINRIKYLLATTFDDNDTYGLEGQVSQSTNFGDQSRTTYAALKPYKLDASSAAISTALINKALGLAQNDPYGAVPDVILVSATQWHKIAELGSGKLAIPSASGPLGLVPTTLVLGGAPVMLLPNMVTDQLVGLSGVRSGDWGFVWNEPNPGRFHVLDLGADGSDTVMNLQISTAGAMLHRNPNKQLYIDSLSTS